MKILHTFHFSNPFNLQPSPPTIKLSKSKTFHSSPPPQYHSKHRIYPHLHFCKHLFSRLARGFIGTFLWSLSSQDGLHESVGVFSLQDVTTSNKRITHKSAKTKKLICVRNSSKASGRSQKHNYVWANCMHNHHQHAIVSLRFQVRNEPCQWGRMRPCIGVGQKCMKISPSVKNSPVSLTKAPIGVPLCGANHPWHISPRVLHMDASRWLKTWRHWNWNSWTPIILILG